MISIIRILYLSLFFIISPSFAFASNLNTGTADSIRFVSPYNCMEKDKLQVSCIIGSFPENLNVVLLGEGTEVCKARTGQKIEYIHEVNEDVILSTRIHLTESCREQKAFDLGVVTRVSPHYKVLNIISSNNSALSITVDRTIRSKNVLQRMASLHWYYPKINNKPKILKYPHPAMKIFIAKYEVEGSDGPIVFMLPGKEFLLEEMCVRDMRAFKLNNRYFLFLDYTGCDCGVVGTSVYDIKSTGIERIFVDETWST